MSDKPVQVDPTIFDAPRSEAGGTLIRDYATTFRPKPDTEFSGRFVRLDVGPENEYGKPFIAVFNHFKGVTNEGRELNETDGDDARRDKEFGLWLIHTTALNGLKELRPAVGELVAGIYLGLKPSKTRKDRNGDPVEYHAYRFACPERPTDAPATWDTIIAVPGEADAPF